MKKLIISAAVAIMCMTNVQAKETCTKPVDNEMVVNLISYLRTNQIQEVSFLLDENCYHSGLLKNKKGEPELSLSFHAFTPKQLEYLAKERKIRVYLEKNLLNQNLVQHWLTVHAMDSGFLVNSNFEEVFKEAFARAKIGKMPTHEQFEEYKVTLEKRREMLDYLSENNLQNYDTTDKFGNRTLHYLVLTGESRYVRNFSKNFFTEFNMRNLDGFTPLHLMFAPKFVVSDEEATTGISNMNKYVASKILENQFNWNNYDKISFVEFAEIMKDNNIEFYDLLKNKYPNLFKNNRFVEDSVEKVRIRDRINNSIDYAKKIQKETVVVESKD